jgi:hypothetical protein
MRTYREELEGQVGDHCSAVILNAHCTGIDEKSVTYTEKDGRECSIEADSVIFAVGMQSRDSEAETFRECAENFRKIGDCAEVGNVKHAIRDAFDAAMTI